MPVYVSLTDSQDLTIEPWLTESNGEVLESEYRQRFEDGGFWLQASVAQNPHGGLDDDQSQTYAHLFGSGRLALDDHWDTGFDAELTSSDTYLKRYDISNEDRLVNDIFVENISDRSRLAVTGYFFEGLRATDNSRTIPFVLPLIEYTYIPERDMLGGQVRFDLNTVSLAREGPHQRAWNQRSANDRRICATPCAFVTGNVGRRFRADGGRAKAMSIIPIQPTRSAFLTCRSGQEIHFARHSLCRPLDWRWPFIASGGQNTSFILEPIRAQDPATLMAAIRRVFPTRTPPTFEFSDSNLFSFEPTSGYDIVDSGPRLNAGLRAMAIFEGGELETLIGQSFRPKPDPEFTVQSGLNRTIS